MGWGEAEDDGRLGRVTGGALSLIVASVYWGLVWVLSGLAPLAYAASHVRRSPRAHNQADRSEPLRQP
jgi:hypothetical protein